MTRTAEVAVVGAGITGLSIALHLAEAGLSPLILERSGIAAGASGVQPGGVRQQWSTRLSCQLAREGATFYRDLAIRLGTSLPVSFAPCGYLFLAHSQARLDELGDAVTLQNEVGVPSRLVNADEARQIVPGLQGSDLVGASWCDEDGYFDHPQTVVEAFAATARSRGAQLEIAEVVSIGQVGADWQLTLRDSSTLTAAQVVLATGCDTAALARQVGLDLPVRPVARHIFFSAPVGERLLEPLVVSAERHFAAKQLADGRLLLGDLSATGDPEAGRRLWIAHVRSVLDDLLPRLSFTSLASLVSGLYDVTPDNHPILGTVDGLPGLHLAVGFSGHGFMLAPAVGLRIADSVLGAAPDEALLQTSYSRFSRGSLHARARDRLDVHHTSTPQAPPTEGRNQMKSRKQLVGLAVVTLAVLAAAVAAAAATGAHGNATASDTLVVDKSFDLKTADPQRQYEPTGGIVDRALYDTLLKFTGADVAHPRPSVATKYTVSKDARTYTFTLRKDVHFSDGTKLTSKDVVFSFNRLVNLKGNPSFLLAGITTSARGAYTVVLKSKTPNPAIPVLVANTSLGIVNSKVVKAHGGSAAANADKADKAESYLNSQSAGSGPYVLKSYSTTTQVVLTRNSRYWGSKAPKFANVVLRNVNSAAQLLNIQRGSNEVSLDLSPTRRRGSARRASRLRRRRRRTSGSCSRTRIRRSRPRARTRTFRTRSASRSTTAATSGSPARVPRVPQALSRRCSSARSSRRRSRRTSRRRSRRSPRRASRIRR